MDKEKEIEEMAKALNTSIVYDGGYGWDDEQEVDCEATARNLFNAGYGNVKQAVEEFAESVVNPIIDELVTLIFDQSEGNCKIERCDKPDSIQCGDKICIKENKQIWKNKLKEKIEELYGKN